MQGAAGMSLWRMSASTGPHTSRPGLRAPPQVLLQRNGVGPSPVMARDSHALEVEHPSTSSMPAGIDSLIDLELEVELTPRRVVNRRLKSVHSIASLRDLVLDDAATFDAANTAFALSRLSKMRDSLARQQGHWSAAYHQAEVDSMGPLLQQLDRMVVERMADMEPWDVANILWSYSKLGHYDKALCNALSLRALELSSELTPVDCANLLTAFGRFGHCHVELLKQVAKVMMYHMEESKPCEVASVMWGYSKLCVPGAPGRAFLEACVDSMSWRLDTFSSQELSMCLYSFARLGHHPGQRLLKAAEAALVRRAPLLNPDQLCSSVWAFGRLRYKAVQLMDEAPGLLAPYMHELQSRSLAMLLCGFSHGRHLHRGFLDAVATIFYARRYQLSPWELSVTLWSLGIFQHRVPDRVVPGLPPPAASSNCSNSSHASSSSGVTEQGEGDAPGGTSALDLAAAAAGRAGISQGASSRPRSGAASPFSDAICAVILERLHYMTPQALANIAKSLGTLYCAPARSSSREHTPSSSSARTSAAPLQHQPHGNSSSSSSIVPSNPSSSSSSTPIAPAASQSTAEVVAAAALQATLRQQLLPPVVRMLAAELCRCAEKRLQEFRPDEAASLLYGVSHLGVIEPHLYHGVVRQCIHVLEEMPQPLQRWELAGASQATLAMHYYRRFLTRATLNSIISSCVRAGHMPWGLVDLAWMSQIHVRFPASYQGRAARISVACEFQQQQLAAGPGGVATGREQTAAGSASSSRGQAGNPQAWHAPAGHAARHEAPPARHQQHDTASSSSSRSLHAEEHHQQHHPPRLRRRRGPRHLLLDEEHEHVILADTAGGRPVHTEGPNQRADTNLVESIVMPGVLHGVAVVHSNGRTVSTRYRAAAVFAADP